VNLRYGTNPEQAARIAAIDEAAPPLRLVSGAPSYINILDALNAWQLVHEAGTALDRPVATSFKHVSPAGAATSGVVDPVMTETWGVDAASLTPTATTYVRARDCDPKSSFGDIVAISVPVDRSLAEVLATVVSDGIIAPGFEPGTADILAKKKGGSFLVLEADPDATVPEWERRDLYGMVLEQQSALTPITREVISAGTSTTLPDSVVDDLLLASITARYTQSNTITYAKDGMILGVGAGQQSRVDCTKLAGAKVDTWWMRRLEAVRSLAFRPDVRRQDRINWQIRYIEGDLTADESGRLESATEGGFEPLSADDRALWLDGLTDVSLASDGFIPFRDNIDHAARHGVRYIAHPGGSTRQDEVADACTELGIVLTSTGIRLFHH
jgi:phosphoribosylaminoimidazolecarboxamide formyltransferase/IMP cyclohydrolase